jgi:hypothetical protein
MNVASEERWRVALAGTALFALSASAGMEVTVGGYDDFRAGFFVQRLPSNVAKRHNDFENEFQLEIEAKDKTANGIEYGAVRLFGTAQTISPIRAATSLPPTRPRRS